MSVVFSTHNASPQTSDGGVSFYDESPLTAITAYSPEDVRSSDLPTRSPQSNAKAPPSFALPSSAPTASGLGLFFDTTHNPRDSFDRFTQVLVDPFTVQNGNSTRNDAGVASRSRLPKLSPEASCFTPTDSPATGCFPTGVGLLSARSVPDIAESPFCSNDPFTPPLQPCKRTNSQGSLSSGTMDPIGSGRPSVVGTPTRPGSVPTSDSDNDASNPTRRYVAILGMPQTEAAEPRVRTSLSKEGGFPPCAELVFDVSEDDESVNIYMAFDDLRDAGEAQRVAQKVNLGWQVLFITQPQFIRATAGQPSSRAMDIAHSPFEGEVIVHARPTAHGEHCTAATCRAAVRAFAECFGPVRMVEKPQSSGMEKGPYRVEFFKISDANRAVLYSRESRGGIAQGSFILWAEDYSPPCRVLPPNGSDKARQEPRQMSRPHYDESLESALDELDLNQHTPVRRTTVSSQPLGLKISPTGRTYIPDEEAQFSFDSPFQARRPSNALAVRQLQDARGFPSFGGPYSIREHGTIGQERSPYGGREHSWALIPTPSMAMSRFGTRRADFASSPHNVVDVHRIRQGLDVRTTIMLRNIPNKIDLEMLKMIVNETSFGRYDFMYLRIDFQNNCNVGYAFINFEDAAFIIDFVERLAGQKWNRFNSDKVAEVSYATIQGRDCLIQKFRNSSVMCESPQFRPKLFYTENHPLVLDGLVELGTEEPFPAPDNHSKLQRSIDNAEQIGLFAPREGQQFRDEQRRRRSQFDRGTPYADFEDTYEAPGYRPYADVGSGRFDRYGRRPSDFPRDFMLPPYPPIGGRRMTGISCASGFNMPLSPRPRLDYTTFDVPLRRSSAFGRAWY